MRASTILLSGLAAVALAAPIEVMADLAERQYTPNTLRLATAEVADVEKRQYAPNALRLAAEEDAEVEKRQYAPNALRLATDDEADVEKRQYRPTTKQIKEAETAQSRSRRGVRSRRRRLSSLDKAGKLARKMEHLITLGT